MLRRRRSPRTAVDVGPLDLDLHVETTGAQDRGVDEILAVRRADDDHVLQCFDAVDLRGQLSTSGRSILIFTSRRPGRRIAGSMRSSRFDAPMTITFFNASTPSISAS